MTDDERIAAIQKVISQCDAPFGDLCQACKDSRYLLGRLAGAERRGMESAAEIVKSHLVGVDDPTDAMLQLAAAAILDGAAKLEERR